MPVSILGLEIYRGQSLSFTLGRIVSHMAKKRVSIKKAEFHDIFEGNYERRARDFAFESQMVIEVDGCDVFLCKGSDRDLLCVVEDSGVFWRTVWRAMCEQFPALARYL